MLCGAACCVSQLLHFPCLLSKMSPAEQSAYLVQAVTERGRKERLQARAGQDQNSNAASNGNGAVSKANNEVATSRQ